MYTGRITPAGAVPHPTSNYLTKWREELYRVCFVYPIEAKPERSLVEKYNEIAYAYNSGNIYQLYKALQKHKELLNLLEGECAGFDLDQHNPLRDKLRIKHITRKLMPLVEAKAVS